MQYVYYTGIKQESQFWVLFSLTKLEKLTNMARIYNNNLLVNIKQLKAQGKRTHALQHT